jgi:hypothetical protein
MGDGSTNTKEGTERGERADAGSGPSPTVVDDE